jgi:hypothetical protein
MWISTTGTGGNITIAAGFGYAPPTYNVYVHNLKSGTTIGGRSGIAPIFPYYFKIVLGTELKQRSDNEREGAV